MTAISQSDTRNIQKTKQISKDANQLSPKEKTQQLAVIGNREVLKIGEHRLQFFWPIADLKKSDPPIPILAYTNFLLSEMLPNMARKLLSWLQWGDYC